jgi:hypothetical protein
MGIMRENGAYQFLNRLGVCMSKVLEKLLQSKSENLLIEKFLKPKVGVEEKNKRPGRPSKSEDKKSRNFTLCLAPQYLNFLDKMVVKDPRVKGRGRKIRFIIERFIEHEKRSLVQIKALRRSLIQVQEVLESFGPQIKKGEKLALSSREKTVISKVVDNVILLMNILGYQPKALHRLLPREDWMIVSFCLDWKNNRNVVL